MSSRSHYVEAFAHLRNRFQVDRHLISVLEMLVCDIYGKKSIFNTQCSIDAVRYSLYCQREGKISCETLPPCKNSLRLHILRANYQAGIWLRALENFIYAPAPDGHGWTINDGQLNILWMTCKPAPEEILELISCTCKKCDQSCTYAQHKLSCTDACKCSHCENISEDILFDDSDVSDLDTDDDMIDD